MSVEREHTTKRFDEELEAWLTEIREEAYVELKI